MLPRGLHQGAGRAGLRGAPARSRASGEGRVILTLEVNKVRLTASPWTPWTCSTQRKQVVSSPRRCPEQFIPSWSRLRPRPAHRGAGTIRGSSFEVSMTLQAARLRGPAQRFTGAAQRRSRAAARRRGSNEVPPADAAGSSRRANSKKWRRASTVAHPEAVGSSSAAAAARGFARASAR
ncbi:hypothetical protein QJS66_03385 [Kocuria rhizophila]|nr:hypothetical protein QJS66_03385 [Kocuria rhizophila]